MIDPRALAKDSLIEEDFLLELKASGRSDATLVNYRNAVDTLDNLGNTPEEMEKKDFVRWCSILRDKYAESSQSLFKACVRRYVKWLKTGNLDGDGYPSCIEWMKTGCNRRNKKLPKEILSHEEVKELAETVDNQRNRAMIWVGYESGCRPGELLGMKIRDVEFDEYGAKITVSGKTGERRIRLVESVPDLKNWLSMHPTKDDPETPLWSNFNDGGLSYSGWYRILSECTDRAGIKKKVHPHLLRHSRATHLAGKGINEAQMREIFGWTNGSDMPSDYVHLSGRDTDGAILDLYGIKVKPSENQFEEGTKKCSFCKHTNSPNAIFCEKCNGPLDSQAAEQSEKLVRKQENHVQKLLEFIREEHPKVLLDFYEGKENLGEILKLGKGILQ